MENKEEQKKLLIEIMDADAKDGLYHIGDTNKMVTAVEWLIDWMGKNQYFIGNDLLEVIEQVKEMEKYQIKQAYIDSPTYSLDSEQYYNYKYGK